MKTFRLYLFVLLLICGMKNYAQHEINPVEGYSPQIGAMVNMMEDLKARIVEMTKDLSQEETDFLFDEKANSIGALIMHIAANEAYYQVETLEGRNWTEQEAAIWSGAGGLDPEHKDEFKGKPIIYYLEMWEQVRKKTLEGLKTKDDAWFAAEVDEDVNNHWVWFHVMEHSANHMGQIALVKNRLPKD